MSSYLIVGVSRGIGFELLRQLSDNSSNLVIGIARNVEATKAKIDAELNGRSNIHILQGDLDHYEALPDLVKQVSEITGGKLEHFIGSAAVPGAHAHLNVKELGEDPQRLDNDLKSAFQTNAVGYAHYLNSFMPLILAGTTKKIAILTSAMGEPDLVRNYDVWIDIAYSTSKAALNLIIAKFSALYREQGVLVFGISPGFVSTHDISGAPEEVLKAFGAMVGQFQKAAPEWKGAITPEESARMVLSVFEKARVDDGSAGDMVSHFGNKQWL